MLRRLILTTFLVACASMILAQEERQFYVDAPKYAVAGESFQVKYILKNPKSKNPRFIPQKDVKGLEYYGMSSYRSQQSSVTIINGKLKAVTTYTITWILTYVANKPGEYTIPPAKVDDNGDILTSNPVTITIGGNAVNQLPKPKQTAGKSEDNFVPSTNKNLFLRLVASKTSVYIGEPVYVYTRIYSVYHLSVDDLTPAKFPGFWVQELDMPSRIQAEDVVINGRTYLAATLDKRVIFPQETGKLKIEPYKLTVTVYDRFGFPFGQKDVVSNSLTINVKPLPQAGKPASFGGAVGKYDFNVTLNDTKVNVDEPLTIKLTITGTGNFGLFDIPKPVVPGSFEELEPKEIPQYKATEAGMQGRLVEEYIYIPRSTGEFVIPPIEFSYFNPADGKYHTIKSDTIKITVSGTSDTTQIYNTYKSEVKQLGTDINYIETGPIKLRPKGKFFAGSAAHYLAYLILLILFALLVLLERKKIKENSDIRRMRAKKASKVSSKRLRVARKYLKAGNKEQFYEEVAKALWGYLGDKLGIDPAELTRDTVREQLENRNVPKDLIDEFVSIIDNCEFARYAPADVSFSMEDIYSRAKKLIDALEDII